MNIIEKTLLTFIIGDYILDQETKDKRIDMLPRPFAYLRDKYLTNRLEMVINTQNGKGSKTLRKD